MPRTEADSWASSSAYRSPVFHVTTNDLAESIRHEGFVLGRRGFGSFWGIGVYATPDPAVASRYAVMLP